ncbi:hypothetical protein QSH57_014231 [Fusarium oxysporum f. sp. vasinfectum]|nr:hypothetical protein QSH57_014231 [Fusarium oxysporum f. sp. vasinfectum]
MANDERENSQSPKAQAPSPSPSGTNDGSRPQTAHRVSHTGSDDLDHNEATETSEMTDDTAADTSQAQPANPTTATSPHDIAITVDDTHAKSQTRTNPQSTSNPPHKPRRLDAAPAWSLCP